MSRIDNLLYSNVQMQGVQRRQWLQQNSPQHLQQAAARVVHALRLREAATSRSTLVLGAGACTEVPLVDLARASDEVVLADLDLPSMQQARDELTSSALRKQIHLLKCDISGGVSHDLERLIAQQNWSQLASQGARAVLMPLPFAWSSVRSLILLSFRNFLPVILAWWQVRWS